MLEWFPVGRRERGRPKTTRIADVGLNETMVEKGLGELDWIARKNKYVCV